MMLSLSYAVPDLRRAERPLCAGLAVAGATLWLSASLLVLAAAWLGYRALLPALPSGMIVAVVAFLAHESRVARAFWLGVLAGVLTSCVPLFAVGMIVWWPG